MTPSIYAESLLNLRQVTVCISLTSEPDAGTRLSLSAQNTVLQVYHRGHTCSIKLPVAVSDAASLKLPPHPKQEFSLRLPFAADVSPSELCGSHKRSFPWSAKALAGVEELSCQACGSTWIGAEAVRQWKDLPHEDWAEMMDLWHCHKPHNPPTQNGTAPTESRGYAASNKLTAQQGVGLVGVSSVLVSPESCSGVKLRSTQSDGKSFNEALECETCHAEVGYVDDRANGWRLYAWSMSGRLISGDSPISWPIETSFSAYILALINSQATTKFILHSDIEAGDNNGLLLWVFNTDLYYSSSQEPDGPKRAMKVFYQRVADASEYVQRLDQAIDDVRLPSQALHRLLQSLDRTNELLPASARRFQVWHVALLERSNAQIEAHTEDPR